MWPWNNQGIASPNLGVTPQQRQYFAGTDWRSQMQPLNAWSNIRQVPNTLEQDIAQVAKDTSQEEFDSLDDNPNWEDTTKYMRLKDEPYFAENWTPKDIFDMNTTLGGYQKWPSGDQFNNKDRWLMENPQGLAATEVAQNKGWDWSKFPSPMNALRAMAGAVKDSPQEAFNRETFSTYGGGPMENRIAEHPMDSLFGNMNVSSMFGSLDQAGQKRIDRLTKAIAAMEGPGGDATKGKWSKLYQGDEEDRAEFERRLDVLRNRKIAFMNQLKQYNDDLVAQGIKEKAAAAQTSAAQQQAAADRLAGAFSSQVQRDPGRDTWHGQTAAKERQGQSVAGPGFGKGAYFNRGGRVGAMGGGLMNLGRRPGYANGDMVAQETDFIEGPQGGEEFQETVVEGPEQPSREQLEALAMAIFNAPLEELDDQQLLLVYQEAMQGQPMEEAVQEDVQFAANGGLAGLL